MFLDRSYRSHALGDGLVLEVDAFDARVVGAAFVAPLQRAIDLVVVAGVGAERKRPYQSDVVGRKRPSGPPPRAPSVADGSAGPLMKNIVWVSSMVSSRAR